MLGAVRKAELCSWRRGGLALLALLGLSFGGTASAQLNVLITKGIERPTPMAIVPFGWSGAGPVAYDIAGVVSADLKSSGRFAPIAESDMVSRPTQPDKINFADWRLLKVDYIVIGTLTETAPDQFTTVFQLFDVLRGEQMLGLSVHVGAGGPARDRAQDLRHDLREARRHPGRVQHADRVRERGEAHATAGKRFRLIVSDADGENAHIVADSPQPLLSPSWSPDGRRLAYVSFEGDQQAVFVQTLNTGTRERVSSRKGVNSSPAFSPDGRLLALTLSNDQGNLDIFTLDVATQVLRQLTTDAAIDTEASVVAGRPHAVLQLGPLGRSADLSSRRRARCARAARDVRRRLQRAAARVAGRQEDRGRLRHEQPISDRRDRRRERRAADTHERAGSTSRRASRRTARRSSTRRATTAAACSLR